MKKVLIVSPHFPPINAPDMQRVRMSLPYYRSFGWEPVVLAVADADQEGVREQELTATVPDDIRVVRSRAVPARLARRVGVGNIGLRSWPYLWRAGARLLRQEKFDLVFFSNTQFITFALGPLWRRRFGVPYAVDLQDPWLTDHYERPGTRPPPGGWKYRFARLQARWLEGWVLRRAAALMSVSPNYLATVRERYPGLAATPSAALPFGASRADLVHARALPSAQGPSIPAKAELRLVYTGASGPIAPALLELLFQALRSSGEAVPAPARRLKVHFIGTSYLPPGRGRPSILPTAEAAGVADRVAEVPHRIGFFEALRLQADADALLLLGSSDPAYSPSKLYPYYLAGRPILAVVYRDSLMERLLDELGCAEIVRIGAGDAPEAAVAAIRAFLIRLAAGEPIPSPRREAHFNAHFLAEELTRRQCELFNAALATQTSDLPS